MRVCNSVFSMRPSHRFDARNRSRAHPQSATAAALRAAPQASAAAASSRAFLIGPPAAAPPRRARLATSAMAAYRKSQNAISEVN